MQIVLLFEITLILIISERRIILMGKIGAGKSHSANGILNKKHFVSKKSWRSVTDEVTYGTATRGGVNYKVYDTPGALNPKDKKKFPEEVVNCLLCTAPGFHCLTLVISTSERATEEDLKLYETLEKELGSGYENHLMIIFTKSESIEEVNALLASGDCEEIQRIVRKVNERYVCFGEDKKDVDKKFVDVYIKKLNEMVNLNIRKRREHYTHKMYTKVQEFLDGQAAIIMKKENISVENAFELARERAINGEIDISKLNKDVAESCCAIL